MLLQVLADEGRAQDGVYRVNQVNFPKKMTEENLRLEPLGDEVLHHILYSFI